MIQIARNVIKRLIANPAFLIKFPSRVANLKLNGDYFYSY